MSLRRFPTQTMVVLLVMLITGCKDREITAYRAPKDAAQPVPGSPVGMANTNDLPPGHPPIGGTPATTPADASAPMAGAQMRGGGGIPVVTEGNAITWAAPTHWIAKPNGAVRKGSYTVPGDGGATADLSITAFPGDTGGLFANVNRWRGQVGLAPIAESELQGSLEHLDTNGFHIEIVTLAGTSNSLLGAIVPFNGQTWFFKLAGPAAIITKEKAGFRDFLRTVKPAQL